MYWAHPSSVDVEEFFGKKCLCMESPRAQEPSKENIVKTAHGHGSRVNWKVLCAFCAHITQEWTKLLADMLSSIGVYFRIVAVGVGATALLLYDFQPFSSLDALERWEKLMWAKATTANNSSLLSLAAQCFHLEATWILIHGEETG